RQRVPVASAPTKTKAAPATIHRIFLNEMLIVISFQLEKLCQRTICIKERKAFGQRSKYFGSPASICDGASALVTTGNAPVVPATCRLFSATAMLTFLSGACSRSIFSLRFSQIAIATVEPRASAKLGETEADDDAILDDPAEVVAGAVAGWPERTEATVVVGVPLAPGRTTVFDVGCAAVGLTNMGGV